MGKYLGPSCKQCRREGEKLFLKGERCHTSKCAVVKRNFVPGMHGNKGRPRLTGYGIQLREKQKAKRTYQLLERQFRGYFDKAKQSHGKTGELMLAYLESRFDNVVYRSGLATSRAQARQMVSHNQFLLNDRPVNIPSIQVKVGDVITVKKTKTDNELWKTIVVNTTQEVEVPAWLTVDRSALKVTIVQAPASELINSPLQMNLIIELYSL